MSVTREITVQLEPQLLERLEKLAKLTGKSIAELVELHVKLVAGWRPPAPPLSEAVQRLQGSLHMPATTSYDQLRDDYLTQKYGLGA